MTSWWELNNEIKYVHYNQFYFFWLICQLRLVCMQTTLSLWNSTSYESNNSPFKIHKYWTFIYINRAINCHGYIRREQSLKYILPVIITFKENYQMTKTLVYFNCTVKTHYILILRYLRATWNFACNQYLHESVGLTIRLLLC